MSAGLVSLEHLGYTAYAVFVFNLEPTLLHLFHHMQSAPLLSSDLFLVPGTADLHRDHFDFDLLVQLVAKHLGLLLGSPHPCNTSLTLSHTFIRIFMGSEVGKETTKPHILEVATEARLFCCLMGLWNHKLRRLPRCAFFWPTTCFSWHILLELLENSFVFWSVFTLKFAEPCAGCKGVLRLSMAVSYSFPNNLYKSKYIYI